MPKRKEEIIFERYNPKQDVKRCPRGRSPVRKVLDLYAKASVNLYGLITVDELADIYNLQNTEKTNPEEIRLLLLPLILKDRWYGFYKEYIVHYYILENYDFVDYLLSEQLNKPRFVPKKEEFILYANEYHNDTNELGKWQKIYQFLNKNYPDNFMKYDCYEEIKEYFSINDDIVNLGKILNEYGIEFSDIDEANKFLGLLSDAKNNTRIWENKGYTPSELIRINEKNNENQSMPMIKKSKKIGPNEPCPCGSGKKFKKCCGLALRDGTAQLSADDARLFYEIWLGLIDYVNAKKQITTTEIDINNPYDTDAKEIYKIRQTIWDNPCLIDDYIGETELTQEKKNILRLWESKHIKGSFVVMKYTYEHALLLGMNEKNEDRIYAIKGISEPIANIVSGLLPVQIDTVLLPFKGMIIFDSFLSIFSVAFGSGAKKMFRDIYEAANKHGVITEI